MRGLQAAALWGPLIACGCLGHERGAGATGAVLYDTPPLITDISYDCSRNDEEWSFEVDTDHWTANGGLYLAVEESYAEQHTIKSVSADADGQGDHLELTLSIEADWRDASSGSSTAFQCAPSTWAAMSYRLVVYTPGSEDVSDCRSWGAQPELFDQVDDVPACEQAWNSSDTGLGP